MHQGWTPGSCSRQGDHKYLPIACVSERCKAQRVLVSRDGHLTLWHPVGNHPRTSDAGSQTRESSSTTVADLLSREQWTRGRQGIGSRLDLGAKAGCTLITNGTFPCRLAVAHVLEFILASTLPGFLQLFDASFSGLLKCMAFPAAVRPSASDATASVACRLLE